jgi:23S rRNA (guanosine2251-2'-O)-methyltransferase
MRHIIVIAHNLRSCHNVGSLLRTAEGLGIDKVILSGYTPYPLLSRIGHADDRLPHIAAKLDKQIAKTALGAEDSQAWLYESDINSTIDRLRSEGFTIAAIEQTSDSIPLPAYQPPEKLALIIGREVEGIEAEILEMTDAALEIPMYGNKESFNVVQAAAMALYHCRFART